MQSRNRLGGTSAGTPDGGGPRASKRGAEVRLRPARGWNKTGAVSIGPRTVERVDKAGSSGGDPASLGTGTKPEFRLFGGRSALEPAVDGQQHDGAQQRHDEAGPLAFLMQL